MNFACRLQTIFLSVIRSLLSYVFSFRRRQTTLVRVLSYIHFSRLANGHFRLYQMYVMRTIAIDDLWRLSIYQSRCLLRCFTQHCCANTAERIEVLLEMETYRKPIRREPDCPHRFDAAYAKLLWPLVFLI